VEIYLLETIDALTLELERCPLASEEDSTVATLDDGAATTFEADVDGAGAELTELSRVNVGRIGDVTGIVAVLIGDDDGTDSVVTIGIMLVDAEPRIFEDRVVGAELGLTLDSEPIGETVTEVRLVA
jgi:hypothetical protein